MTGIQFVLSAIACAEAILMVGLCVNGLYEIDGRRILRMLILGPDRATGMCGLLTALALHGLAVLGASVLIWVMFYGGRPNPAEVALGAVLTTLSLVLSTRPWLGELSSRS